MTAFLRPLSPVPDLPGPAAAGSAPSSYEVTDRRGPRRCPPLLSGWVLATTLAAFPLPAQQDATGGIRGDEATVVLDDPGISQVRLAIPEAELADDMQGDYLQAAQEIEQTLRDDLDQMRLFATQGPTELSVLVLTGNRDQDFDQYRSLGNDVVLLTEIKREADKLVLDGWVYDLPSRQSVLGKRYRGNLNQPRQVAHYLADAIHYQFSRRPSLTLTTIAFQGDRDGFQELYLMDYDGRNQRRISGHKSTSGYGSWSPSGDAIAYMSYFSGTPGIYYVDIASGDKVPIYTEGILNLSPSFAPDGERIAFASSRDGNVDVYACERSCQNPRRLTRSRAIDTNPAWSPDGSKIAFTSSRSGRPHIYAMDADGNNVRRVSFEGEYNEGAAWSPDGSSLVYASRKGNRFRIAVTSLVDLQARLLAEGPDSYEEPVFSPDGQKVAFTVRKGRQAQVYVMDADGGNWRQLTHQGNNSAPSWSSFPKRRATP